jgi:flagellar biosynthesis protein
MSEPDEAALKAADALKRFNARMKAVAVKYDPSEVAPRVVAKGTGRVAGRIVDKANELNLPVYKDAKLTEDLTKLELGQYIPPELYDAVAQVMVFISDLDKLEEYRRHAK